MTVITPMKRAKQLALQPRRRRKIKAKKTMRRYIRRRVWDDIEINNI